MFSLIVSLMTLVCSFGILQASNKDFAVGVTRTVDSINGKQIENSIIGKPMGIFVGEL